MSIGIIEYPIHSMQLNRLCSQEECGITCHKLVYVFGRLDTSPSPFKCSFSANSWVQN